MKAMRWVVIVAVMQVSAVLPARAEAVSPGDAERVDEFATFRQVTIAQALVMLNEETRDATKRGWPTEASDFAQRKRVRVENSELVRVLGMKLNNDLMAEGYVKWQLLSFRPDLHDVTAEKVRALLSAMPGLEEQPTPRVEEEPPPQEGMSIQPKMKSKQRVIQLGQEPVPGTRLTRPKLMVVGDGLTIGPAARERDMREGRAASMNIAAASRELDARREAVAAANEASLRYRDGFVGFFPREGGARLAAMLRDVEDRIATGEPGYEKAIDRFIEEAEETFGTGSKMKDGKPAATRPMMTTQGRLNLAEIVLRISRMRFDVVTSVAHAPGGGYEVRTKTIGFAPRDLERAMAALGVEMKEQAESPGEKSRRR